MPHDNPFETILRVIVATGCAMLLCASAALAQKAMAEDCTMAMETVWLDEFQVSASAEGECGLGALSLVVRNGTDEVVWSASYRPENLFGFTEVFSPQEMEIALSDWITTHISQSSTAILPPWAEGADGPDYSEFPFYPYEEMDQASYEMTRDYDLLMVCYVQGMESTLCLYHVPDEPRLEPIGYQSFPG